MKLRNAAKTGCDFRQILKALQQFRSKFVATRLCFVKHLYNRAAASSGHPPIPDKCWGEMLFYGHRFELQPWAPGGLTVGGVCKFSLQKLRLITEGFYAVSISGKAYFMRKRICIWKVYISNLLSLHLSSPKSSNVWELRGPLRIRVSVGISQLPESICRGQLLPRSFLVFFVFSFFIICLFPCLAMQMCNSELWPT